MDALMGKIAFPSIQVLLCLLAGSAILQLRYRLARNRALPRERALRFLSAALGVWLVMGSTQIFGAAVDWDGYTKEWVMSVLSASSDLFVILAATQLDYAPRWLRSARPPAWPFLIVIGGLCLQFGLVLIPFFRDPSSPVRLWEIPGTLVSMFAGTILIFGLCRSFRQYQFAFPWWLGIAVVFLSAWVAVQPLYLIRALDDSVVPRLVSTGGIVVFVMSSMTLLLAWIHSMVVHIPLETLFATGSAPEYAEAPTASLDDTEIPVLKGEAFARRGEQLLGNIRKEVRDSYPPTGLLAVDVQTGELVFGHDDFELADAVAHAQIRGGHTRCYYARNLSDKLQGEG